MSSNFITGRSWRLEKIKINDNYSPEMNLFNLHFLFLSNQLSFPLRFLDDTHLFDLVAKFHQDFIGRRIDTIIIQTETEIFRLVLTVVANRNFIRSGLNFEEIKIHFTLVTYTFFTIVNCFSGWLSFGCPLSNATYELVAASKQKYC